MNQSLLLLLLLLFRILSFTLMPYYKSRCVTIKWGRSEMKTILVSEKKSVCERGEHIATQKKNKFRIEAKAAFYFLRSERVSHIRIGHNYFNNLLAIYTYLLIATCRPILMGFFPRILTVTFFSIQIQLKSLIYAEREQVYVDDWWID